MLDVFVCLGTSCHLRGGEVVAEQIGALLGEYGLKSEVRIKGSFCLEHCSDGVSVKIGDTVFDGVKIGQVRERLLPEILARTGVRQ